MHGCDVKGGAAGGVVHRGSIGAVIVHAAGLDTTAHRDRLFLMNFKTAATLQASFPTTLFLSSPLNQILHAITSLKSLVYLASTPSHFKTNLRVKGYACRQLCLTWVVMHTN